MLTHWGRVTHICVSKLTIIGSDNGLLPNRRQAIILTNSGILLIGPLGTNFSEIWIEIQIFSLGKIHLKMSSTKWRPFCLGLNVLRKTQFRCQSPSDENNIWRPHYHLSPSFHIGLHHCISTCLLYPTSPADEFITYIEPCYTQSPLYLLCLNRS